MAVDEDGETDRNSKHGRRNQPSRDAEMYLVPVLPDNDDRNRDRKQDRKRGHGSHRKTQREQGNCNQRFTESEGGANQRR